MEYIGRIAKIENERQGVSAKTGNPWHSISFVFEYFTPENQRYPDSVLLETMDENIINQLKNDEIFKNMNAKSCVKIAFYHKTRTYENRTFNDIRINKFEYLPAAAGLGRPQMDAPASTEQAAQATNEDNQAASVVPPTPQADFSGDNPDNLPF